MTVQIDLQGRCGECLLFGAIQGLADGLVLFDPDGRTFHVNRRAAELLGVETSRVLGARFKDVMRHPELIAFWESATGETDPVTSDILFPPARSVRAIASVCLSADGRPIGRALLLRDVTRDKTIQLELSVSVAKRLVEMTGGEPGSAIPPLTAREREILALLAGGLSNAAIGSRLHVSVNTVASHLKNLYRKLKLSSRSQAAAFALSHGIRPPEI